MLKSFLIEGDVKAGVDARADKAVNEFVAAHPGAKVVAAAADLSTRPGRALVLVEYQPSKADHPAGGK